MSASEVGIGYDSHRFAEGRRLILGGVEIPHERGLAGHSDADVLTHAVIDASSAPPARRHRHPLPDDEERWRDADSIELLRAVVGTIAGRVVNVDATVICEEPRIGPHREEMERGLARRPRPGSGQGDDERGPGRSGAARGSPRSPSPRCESE